MTIWHWVRHGPTHQKTFCGWRDVPADLTDRAALARLTAALPAPALLVSSDLVRATATAECLAQGRERLPDMPALREFDFGEWDGLGFAEIEARHPDLSRAFWDDPGDVAPPGGESWHRLAARVAQAVDRLTQQHPEAHIIAVAHFGVILTQVQRALGRTPRETLAQPIANLSVTELHHHQGHWTARRINHTP